MDTFYTIIKIAPNNMTGDNLSIGLLLRDSKRFWLHFSESKINTAKHLVGDGSKIIESTVSIIKTHINDVNTELVNAHTKLFGIDTLLNSDYISHLKAYCNGLIRFTEPAFINDNMDDSKFRQLFMLLIDTEYEKAAPIVDTREEVLKNTIESRLITRVKDKVHTNFSVDEKKISGLYFNYTLDCIGKNGSYIVAKSIPFFKQFGTLDRELSHFVVLINTLTRLHTSGDSTKDQYFIIGSEPDVNSKEHKVWETFKTSSYIKLIEPEQSGVVADIIEQTNATTFLN